MIVIIDSRLLSEEDKVPHTVQFLMWFYGIEYQ